MTDTIVAGDFGPLVVNTDVDEAIINHVKLWLPTYLAQTERERGQSIGRFNRPKDKSYNSVLTDDEFPDHALPAILVTSADTRGDPQKDGNGNYYAAWNVVISCVVRGRNPRETRWLAAQFEGAVRRIMVRQDIPMDGEVRWTGTSVASVNDRSGKGRYLAAGIGTYVFYVDRVLLEGNGPGYPDNGPYDPPDPVGDPDAPVDPLVEVSSVTTDVTGRSPNQQLGE
jgi:hypothetical protein